MYDSTAYGKLRTAAMANNPREVSELEDGDEEDFDFPTVNDFSTALEDRIKLYCERSTAHPGVENVNVTENDTKKLLKKAKIKFIGYCSNTQRKTSRKRLISRTHSVFRNKTEADVRCNFHKTAEDLVMAEVRTRRGFSLFVAAGLGGGPAMGQLGALVGGGYTREHEHTTGSSATSSTEMEAEIVVPPWKKGITTESVYHVDYAAGCKYDFTIADSHKLKYEWKINQKSKKEDVLINKLPGVRKCEQELVNPNDRDQVHFSCALKCKLTKVQKEISVAIETDTSSDDDDDDDDAATEEH